MRKNAWKEEDIDLLKEMLEANSSWEAMVSKLGRTEVALKCMVAKLGIKRKSSIFTKDELDYIKNSYPTKSIHTLKNELGVAWDTVKNALKNMDIPIELESNEWTEEDIQKLTEYAKDKTIAEIANIMGRTSNAIQLKATRIGIVIAKSKRKWSKEETEYLEQNWGEKSIRVMAKALNRGKDAVLQRAHVLKLTRIYDATELVNLSEFYEYTGISRDRILNTLEPRWGFPVVRKKLVNSTIYFVDLDEVIKWMEENQSLFDGEAVQEGVFIPEPEWLRLKRSKDYQTKEGLNYQLKKPIWEKEELAYASSLLNIGFSYEEIAERIGRSPKATRSKLCSIGKAYKLKKYWKGHEFKFIQDNYETMTDEEMAKALKRTVKSVAFQRTNLGIKRTTRNKRKKKQD